MPRYTLSQLIERANSGQIGYRGLRKLRQSGVNPNELAASGVDISGQLQVDPQEELQARRAALYGQALERAQAGGALSARTQRRLQLGSGSGGPEFLPHSQANVQAVGEHTLSQIMDSVRRRAASIHSAGSIYSGYRR
jgi:hypothetical protein